MAAATAIADAAATADHPAAPDDERVYLVPYRWWRGAQESVAAVDGLRGIPYAATPMTTSYGMKIISIFSSDLVFNLRRSEDLSLGDAEEVVSGRSFSLIPSEVWLQAFKCLLQSSATAGKHAYVQTVCWYKKVYMTNLQML